MFTEVENVASSKKISIYDLVKRSFDLLIGCFGCLFILPISLIVKIIYISSGDYDSIFYKQIRIGKDGNKFKLYKFRSMVKDADKILSYTLSMNPILADEWEKYQKFENDPRITKIGNILRKTSLDELPQFINVIKGDMSMIGPRPLVEGELDAHNGSHEIYESVRPGISGWWQVPLFSDKEILQSAKGVA